MHPKRYLSVKLTLVYLHSTPVPYCAVVHLCHRNAMCGKVQCTGVNVNTPPPGAHVSIQIIQGSVCVNADFNLGTDVLDPAYVKPGSPCAKGKVS